MIEQPVNQRSENHLHSGSSGKLIALMSVIQFPDNKNRDGSQNIRLLAVQPPDVAANPEGFLEFSCFESFILYITS